MQLVIDNLAVLVWLFGGIVLMLLELILPGGVAFFLGLGATLIALLLFLGIISSPLTAFMVWLVGSLILIVGLQGVMRRFRLSTVEQSNTDEDVDAYNQIVEVAETIPEDGEGRIYFRGTTWRARNYYQDRDLLRGSQARLVFRQDQIWVVEGVRQLTSEEERGE